MELKLSRVDYMQVGLTAPKTTRLLPSMGGLSQQKVWFLTGITNSLS